MEHVIMHGIDVDVDKARLVVSLYTKHAQLVDLVKVNSSYCVQFSRLMARFHNECLWVSKL